MEPGSVKIVVGLGNPGQVYRGTRHNVGYVGVEALAGEEARFEKRGLSMICRKEIDGVDVILAKPLTFMNRSGYAVVHLLREFRARVPDLLVVYDDAEIPFGHMRIRQRGSHGGHNGMRSIARELASHEIGRIRLGVGRSDPQAPLADHVLREFTVSEQQVLPLVFEALTGAVALFLKGEVAKAMSLYNRRDTTVDKVVEEIRDAERRKQEAKCTPA